MNQADLLDQFVIEARECLEAIGARLLDVEREPTNVDLLNDLFRSVHTLKGNCGLFEFKALERVVHAGEDLLDRVRHRTLDYSGELADALLEAMDYSTQLIDQIERSGRIDDGADEQSIAHAKALRALLAPAAALAAVTQSMPAGPTSSTGATAAAVAAPDWLGRLAPTLLAAHPAALSLRYVPEEGSFFKGEDPWRLASTAPGLLALQLAPRESWPEGAALAAWDCYQCNLDIVLLSNAPRTELEQHFRCVTEQVALHALADAGTDGATATVTATVADDSVAPEPGQARLQQRAAQLWADQCTLLGHAALPAGSVLAARRTLQCLLQAIDDGPARAHLTALPALPETAAALLGWALAWAGAPGAAAAHPRAGSAAD
uniref:Hpt domain-containing protein n=1 Tax=Methylibium sp. TaxID=2067992 RepID=UPI00181D3160